MRKIVSNIALAITIALLIHLFPACKKSPDISGTYKKVSGDYRYDTIIIERSDNKDNPLEYWLTTFHEDRIRFKTKNTLKDRTILLGFIAPIEFEPDFQQFVLLFSGGSIFRKEIVKKEN